MAEHTTHAIHVVMEGGPIAPIFIPLLDIKADTTLLASQCTLTVAGCPSPLQVQVMLCKPDTVLGDPGDNVLYVSDLVNVVAGEPFVLPGSIPQTQQAGVLGLYVPVQTLLPGAKVEGVLSIVR
jgi:hypothetical protein